MARRVTPSQWKSMMRQAEQKWRQAINKYNREVDNFNREVKNHNRKAKQAVDSYNREVRAHNARVRPNRQRLRNELARLANRRVAVHLTTFSTSVTAVQTTYERLEHAASGSRYDGRYNEILDLSEREAANTAGLMNALLDDSHPSIESPASPPDSPLTPILSAVSADLGDRWRGALYSLNPINPDAARHFCSSAREIIAGILDTKAPDKVVVASMPGCELTPRKTPTRRAKVRYFLYKKGMNQEELEDFIEADMTNVVDLFHVFNKGTHGTAGAFSHSQLQAIRKRTEDAIMFLCRLLR